MDKNGDWRRLHNDETQYHSPNIMLMIKHTRLRWTGHAVRMEKGRSDFHILKGKPTTKNTFRKA